MSVFVVRNVTGVSRFLSTLISHWLKSAEVFNGQANESTALGLCFYDYREVAQV